MNLASAFGAPYLRSIWSDPEKMNRGRFPFNIPAFHDGIDRELPSPVTFFVGENGSGKSTLLEAFAEICGFNPEPTLFTTLPTAEPPGTASGAFRSVEHPHRTGEYASGALGRETPRPQDLSAPRYGTVVNKVG